MANFFEEAKGKLGPVLGAVVDPTGLGSAIADAVGGGLNPKQYTPGTSPTDTPERQAAIEANRKAIAARGGQLGKGLSQVNARPGFQNAQQQALIDQLLAQARGEGPSAAQNQLRAATDETMRQALAYAASSRGNPALAQQAAGRQMSQASQQAANQSAILRAGEQQAAQGLAQQALMGQISAGQQQAAQDDLMRRFYESGISDVVGRQLAADLGFEGLRSQDYATREGLSAQSIAAQNAQQSAILQGILSGAASAGTAAAIASDKTLKKDIGDIKESDLDQFFAAVKPKSYRYKNPGSTGQTAGDKVGFMAQDVADTRLGKKLIRDIGDGKKGYDPQVMEGVLLAAVKKVYEKSRKRA